MSLDFQAALDALRSGEEAVRRATVDQLGRSGLREAIGPLLMAVGDDSWPVRQAATERFAAALATLNLPTLDLLPVLQAQTDPAGLFFTENIHFTPRGHQVVGNALDEFLARVRPFERAPSATRAPAVAAR